MSEKITAGATVWGAQHLPQNREVFMVSAGDGNLYLYKYHYPDQRKVKVRGGALELGRGLRGTPTKPPSGWRGVWVGVGVVVVVVCLV